MTQQLIENKGAGKQSTIAFFKILLLLVLLFGILFRCINIDKKIYWGDESFTSLRISGYTISEIDKEFESGKTITVNDFILQYQKLNLEKDWINMVESLKEDTHPPVYYLMLRFFLRIFGDSITVTRSFSVLIGILSFFAIYWLSQSLFRSTFVSWISMALFAISPFHVLYAQEARMYSLWTLLILVSSASLVRAID